METHFSSQSYADQYLHRGLREWTLDQQYFFDRIEGLSYEQSASFHIAERAVDLQRAAHSKGQQQSLGAGWR